jgi:hypothetical protein
LRRGGDGAGSELSVGHVKYRQADHDGEKEPQRDGGFIHFSAPRLKKEDADSIYDHSVPEKLGTG